MANTLDGLINQLQTFVVAPLNAFGIGGFLFDVQGEALANESAEITDHYTEDNDAIQDHIAIRPPKITLKGYQGEVVYTVPSEDGSVELQKAVQKLTTLSAFLPQLSAAQQQFEDFNSPAPTDISLSDSANIYGLVKNVISSASGQQSKQQQAYNYFVALKNQKILMGIQTPWSFMTSMAIETIVAIQDEKTKFMTDFAVTFKQLRITKTISGAYVNLTPQQQVQLDVGEESPQYQGVAQLQAPAPVQIGNVPGVDPASSAAPLGPGAAQTLPALIANPAFAPIPASQLTPP